MVFLENRRVLEQISRRRQREPAFQRAGAHAHGVKPNKGPSRTSAESVQPGKHWPVALIQA